MSHVAITYINRPPPLLILGASTSRWLSEREIEAMLRGERFNPIC